jgi:hypothetical protein
MPRPEPQNRDDLKDQLGHFQERLDHLYQGIQDVKVKAEINEVKTHLDEVEDSLQLRVQETQKREERADRREVLNTKLTALNILLTALLTLATASAVFIQYKQTEVQNRQAQLETDQSAADTALHLSDSWDHTFDEANRFRFERFRAALAKWNSDPSGRDEALDILVNKDKISNASLVRENRKLWELLDTELKSEHAENDDWAIVKEAFSYRDTIIHCLNTIEAIEAVRASATSSETRHIIDVQFSEISKIWVASLWPFIERYRADPMYVTEQPPAWDPLIDGGGQLRPWQ